MWLTGGPTSEPPYSSQAQRPLQSLTPDQAMPAFPWGQTDGHSAGFLPQCSKVDKTNQGSKWTVHPELSLKDIKKRVEKSQKARDWPRKDNVASSH